MTVSYDLTIPAGDTWRSPRWALVIGGRVVDVADGWTVAAQIRRWHGAADALYTWTSDGGGVETGTSDFTVDGSTVTGSTIRLHLTAQQSETLDHAAGVWDMEVRHPTFDSGQPYRKTIVAGRVRIVAEVTQ